MKMLSASSRSRWVSLVVIRAAVCPLLCDLSLAARLQRPRLSANLPGRPTVTRFQILASAGVALSVAATAQTAPKPVARADYVKSVDAHFNGADTNHDGFLSKAELAAQAERDLATAKTRLNQTLTAKFQQLDTNQDGKLTLQEFL